MHLTPNGDEEKNQRKEDHQTLFIRIKQSRWNRAAKELNVRIFMCRFDALGTGYCSQASSHHCSTIRFNRIEDTTNNN